MFCYCSGWSFVLLYSFVWIVSRYCICEVMSYCMETVNSTVRTMMTSTYKTDARQRSKENGRMLFWWKWMNANEWIIIRFNRASKKSERDIENFFWRHVQSCFIINRVSSLVVGYRRVWRVPLVLLSTVRTTYSLYCTVTIHATL